MDRNALATLAKGLVPFVREVVAEATTPLTARLAELEARPPEKGDAGERGADGLPGPEGPPGPKGESGELVMLPPELAEQVASAVRLLHESPPIVKTEPAPAYTRGGGERGARITSIGRDADGNFVPVYDDQSL